jgi:hypothetical protein
MQDIKSDSLHWSIFGYGYIDHSTCMFEGHPSVLEEGCKDADLLVVDQTMRPYYFADGWHQAASRQMWLKQIVVYDPAAKKLFKVQRNELIKKHNP